MNFEAWRASAYPSDSRLLCSLTVAELDALLATYLHYLWEGSHLQLTHHMLVQQARLLDRYLKVGVPLGVTHKLDGGKSKILLLLLISLFSMQPYTPGLNYATPATLITYRFYFVNTAK